MPAITNVQVVKFSNDKGRRFADALEQVYQTAKRFNQEFDAIDGSTSIPSTADLIDDGAALDGRKRVTANMLHGLKTTADNIVAWFEAGTPTRISRVQRMTVNGESRF